MAAELHSIIFTHLCYLMLFVSDCGKGIEESLKGGYSESITHYHHSGSNSGQPYFLANIISTCER